MLVKARLSRKMRKRPSNWFLSISFDLGGTSSVWRSRKNNERRTLRWPSDSPRRHSPSEKRAPVYVWVKSPLTFDRRHLSRHHYGDTPPPAGATTSPGSRRGSGRATGLSFLGITERAGGRAKSVHLPLLGDLPGGSRDGEHFQKTRKHPSRLRRHITLAFCAYEKRLARRWDDDIGKRLRARCLHRELSRIWLGTTRDNLIARTNI